MKIMQFNSPPPNNPFAPSWNYFLCQELMEDKALITDLKNLILAKEKIIIAKHQYQNNDGGTGLGKDAMTSRFMHFNIFAWDEPCAVDFREFVKEQHGRYLEFMGLNKNTVYGRCWSNVMRKGEKIDMHWHSCMPDSYLSGHFTVATQNTITFYQNPFDSKDVHEEFNEEGLLTFFPSYMRHWTSKYDGDAERITIAFDLYTFGNDVDKGFGQFKDKVEFKYG
jgi:hypothetical protein